jgi:hypothetical protein
MKTPADGWAGVLQKAYEAVSFMRRRATSSPEDEVVVGPQ